MLRMMLAVAVLLPCAVSFGQEAKDLPAKRAVKLARQEREERERIDCILAKVSAHGMHSLSWWQRRKLKKATEHQRQRNIDMRRRNRP
jgi:hypothetical protein